MEGGALLRPLGVGEAVFVVKSRDLIGLCAQGSQERSWPAGTSGLWCLVVLPNPVVSCFL